MSHALVVDLARNAIMLSLLIAGPMLIVALLIGLTVSVLQAVTQIQEQTLAFVPKLVGVSVVFLLALPRSEERRVGKECRSRWWPDDEKRKDVDEKRWTTSNKSSTT